MGPFAKEPTVLRENEAFSMPPRAWKHLFSGPYSNLRLKLISFKQIGLVMAPRTSLERLPSNKRQLCRTPG